MRIYEIDHLGSRPIVITMKALIHGRVYLTASLMLLAPARAAESVPSLFVEGYAEQLSYTPGDEVAFHISTSAAKFFVEISRIGAKTNVVWTKRDVPGKEYPVPEDASAQGCRWPEAFRAPVAKEWRSGYYVARFRAEDTGGRWSQRGRRDCRERSLLRGARRRAGQEHEDPPPTRQQHLQRLQQLGRLQPLRLQRPREKPGQPRVLRPPGRVTVRDLGAALRAMGGAQRLRARLRGELATSNSARNCSRTTSSS